jgi:prepilin-type N-terminal cleavage/methylation domain-containing protein
MCVSPPSKRQLGPQRIPRSARGVGLIELLVVVTILSALMTMALPSYKQIQKRARASALVNDFRGFTTVFLAHAHEQGSWPSEAEPNSVPGGMTTLEIKADTWMRTSPIGGKFDWEYNQMHNGVRYKAAIALVDYPGTPLLLDVGVFEEMDKALDDGNLATGSFILGDGNCPLYILER